MRSLLEDLAVAQHEDDVGVRHVLQPVGDAEDGLPPPEAVERGVHLGGRGGVERGRRLVEDEDGGILDDRPGDGDLLALAAREADASLRDDRVVAVREAQDELVDVGRARRGLHLVDGGVGLPVGDVLADGGAEQDRLLEDDADLLP